MTITNEQAAYIAGLFDGEGSIYFAKRPEKKKKHKGRGYRVSISQRISMEVTMTDQSVIRWVHKVLGCGTVVKKPRKGLRKDGTKYLIGSINPFSLCDFFKGDNSNLLSFFSSK